MFRGPSHTDTPPGHLKSEGGWAKKGKRGQERSEEAELAITTSFLRRTLSVAGVRAQAKLLLSRLEVIGPVAVANAATGRHLFAVNLERRMANQSGLTS